MESMAKFIFGRLTISSHFLFHPFLAPFLLPFHSGFAFGHFKFHCVCHIPLPRFSMIFHTNDFFIHFFRKYIFGRFSPCCSGNFSSPDLPTPVLLSRHIYAGWSSLLPSSRSVLPDCRLSSNSQLNFIEIASSMPFFHDKKRAGFLLLFFHR